MTESRWLPYAEVYPGPGHTVAGDVRVLRGVASHGLAARDLLVYLPPSYASSADKRYPVLYIHDGQNVFDSATSYAGEWGVDETAEDLARRGLETIIVAIPNAGAARVDEYGPWEISWHDRTAGGKADAYLDFLLETVRPAVDSEWRTLTETQHTGIVGSSLGGLVSLYAVLSRPGIFGYCAALSPSLWFAGARILDLVEDRRDPELRIYVDIGFVEGGPPLIGRHTRNLRKLRDLLLEAGNEVVHVEDEHGNHSEADWRRRFPAALEWFLDPTARPKAPRLTATSILRMALPSLIRLPSRRI